MELKNKQQCLNSAEAKRRKIPYGRILVTLLYTLPLVLPLVLLVVPSDVPGLEKSLTLGYIQIFIFTYPISFLLALAFWEERWFFKILPLYHFGLIVILFNFI